MERKRRKGWMLEGGGCSSDLGEYDPRAEILVFLGAPLGGAASRSGPPQARGRASSWSSSALGHAGKTRFLAPASADKPP